ncbi:hypothetical protein JCM39194_15060 [Desulfotomaculum varum]
MAKFPFDEDQLYDFLNELNSNIGEISLSISVDLENNIQDYAERHCSSINKDTLRFVTLCVQDSYFLALKTIEKAIKKTLLPELDSSDDDS